MENCIEQNVLKVKPLHASQGKNPWEIFENRLAYRKHVLLQTKNSHYK